VIDNFAGQVVMFFFIGGGLGFLINLLFGI
jgi:hypothetical protein